MSAAAEFSITLHHLDAEGRAAGASFPDHSLARVSTERLRALLEAFARLAPQAEYPLEPELRIAGPQGRFLVQAKGGQVRVTSWSSQQGGSDLTPDRILALILGVEADEPVAARPGLSGGRLAVRWRVALLAALVLGSNALTAWLLTRPPPPPPLELLPAYRRVEGDRAERLLAEMAGDYETGAAEGDRRLSIARNGQVRWTTLGPNQAVVEDRALRGEPAESRGHAALATDNFGLVELRDPITVVYFGDTYRRKAAAAPVTASR